jgi:hypothetical protein
LSTDNQAQKFDLRLESNAAGTFKRLFLRRAASNGAGEWLDPRFLPRPFDPRREERVLSEDCIWFDMTPGMADAGHAQCRTHDGVALKEDRWSRGSRQSLVAVRSRRRTVDLSEVMPPVELFRRATWGFAVVATPPSLRAPQSGEPGMTAIPSPAGCCGRAV